MATSSNSLHVPRAAANLGHDLEALTLAVGTILVLFILAIVATLWPTAI